MERINSKPTDTKALEQHPLSYRGWSDDGFVLLKHEKESGANTKVVFYSLYMHLSKLETRIFGEGAGKVQMGIDTTVRRKSELGTLGSVYDKPHSMHFEIFTDEASLKAFIKRGTDNYKVDGEGRGEPDLWGDVHFAIPKGTPYWPQDPDAADSPPMLHNPKITSTTLCVSVAYSRAPTTGPTQDVSGNRLITTYLENGVKIGERADPGLEFKLYKLAEQRFPQHISAGYELLRFGRVIGPDSLPPNARNWQKIPLDYGRQGWIDLNEAAIKKLSDADFPYWHWRHIEEPAATAHDGKCEPAVLLQQLDKNHDGTLAPLEFARFVRDEDSRKRLSHTICKFPSEWDASDFDQRWGWLKDYFKNPARHDKELALMHKAWLELLQTRLTPLQTSAEQQLKDAQSAHQDLVEEKAKSEKDKLDLTNKIAELEKQQKQQIKTFAQQEKIKNTKAEDLAKSQAAIIKSAEEIASTRKSQGEAYLKITAANENLETSAHALKICEQTLESIKQQLKSMPDELKAADEEIKRADEALKAQPPNPNSDKLWQEFKAHVTALQFWDKVPGLPDPKQVWHFHPVAFVEHLKKCHWLSERELAQIYLEKDVPQKSRSKHAYVLEFYRKAINQIFFKYGVVTPIRMAHYFGQGAVESKFLHSMQEAAMTPKKIENGKAYGKEINADSERPEHELGHWYGSAPGEKTSGFVTQWSIPKE